MSCEREAGGRARYPGYATWAGVAAILWSVLIGGTPAALGQGRSPAAALELEESVGDTALAGGLREAPVTASREIGSGVTKPLRLELDWNGRSLVAAFKFEHIEVKGLSRFENAPPELNFVDSYLFDRAAYLLDRELGLGMVPVTVLRRFNGDDGAVVDWIEGSITQTERQEKGLEPAVPTVVARQKALARVFDALIMNVDRNAGNLLYTPDDWRLHLIDHTRAFRMTRKPPESFMKPPAKISPELLAGLRELEEGRLVELMKGVLTRARIRAMLVRRDAIVEKLEADRVRLGDAYVLIPVPTPD